MTHRMSVLPHFASLKIVRTCISITHTVYIPLALIEKEKLIFAKLRFYRPDIGAHLQPYASVVAISFSFLCSFRLVFLFQFYSPDAHWHTASILLIPFWECWVVSMGFVCFCSCLFAFFLGCVCVSLILCVNRWCCYCSVMFGGAYVLRQKKRNICNTWSNSKHRKPCACARYCAVVGTFSTVLLFRFMQMICFYM